jgi:hypothetical protein
LGRKHSLRNSLPGVKNSLRGAKKFPGGGAGIYRETRGFRRVPGGLDRAKFKKFPAAGNSARLE